MNYSKFINFIDKLPENQKDQFQALISECYTVTKATLQVLLNAADIAFRSIVIYHIS